METEPTSPRITPATEPASPRTTPGNRTGPLQHHSCEGYPESADSKRRGWVLCQTDLRAAYTQAASSERSSPLSEAAALQVLGIPWEPNMRPLSKTEVVHHCSPAVLSHLPWLTAAPVLYWQCCSKSCPQTATSPQGDKYRTARKHPGALTATRHCCNILILFYKSADLPQNGNYKTWSFTTGNF